MTTGLKMLMHKVNQNATQKCPTRIPIAKKKMTRQPILIVTNYLPDDSDKKVQVGNDQTKAQPENDSHSKNRGGKKTKLTIKYLYHKNIS